MRLSEIWQQFVNDVQHTGWKEWLSTVTQVASVWYAKKNSILVYPTGIIGVLLAAYIYFFESAPPLYADAVLNIFYFIMSVYGWYNWMLKKKNAELTYPISWCSNRERLNGFLFFIGSWIAIFLILKQTDSNTPFLDSLVSSSAITAMWWMAKRKIENWLAWIFSNLVAIPLNFYKHFMLFTVMYILFLVLAIWGYIEWKKQVRHD